MEETTNNDSPNSSLPKVDDAIYLTAAASQYIKKVLAAQSKKNCFRLSIKRSGCSGFAYVISYVNDSEVGSDLRFPVEGNSDLFVFVDQPSYPFLKGLHIDYVRSGLNSSLKFTNPNQASVCGCGESFNVKEK